MVCVFVVYSCTFSSIHEEQSIYFIQYLFHVGEECSRVQGRAADAQCTGFFDIHIPVLLLRVFYPGLKS